MDINQKISLATSLFSGGSQATANSVPSRMTEGTAMADSSGGIVPVDIGGEVIDCKCITAVKEGDTVSIFVQGGAPTVLGKTGWGDDLEGRLGDIRGTYLHVRFSAYSDGRDFTEAPQDDTLFMGVCSNESAEAPTDKEAYTWVLVKGNDGVQGDDGKDGTSSYLHIKYSNDGGATFTANSGETVGDWMGTCVTENQADPTSVSAYTWKKVKGEQGEKGNGIAYSLVTYQEGDSGTTAPTGTWSSDVPPVSEGKYLWTRTDLTFDDGTKSTSYNVSKVGSSGADGKTTYVHIKYSNDGGVTFTANNGEDVGEWIGTCTDTNVDDPTNVSAYKWALIKGADGQDGQDGSDGVSVTSTTRYYQLAASKPSAPTANPPSGWSTTEPTYTAGSTDSLFFVDLTAFSDGAWSYSAVSQSSSYDAAKIAYDSAITAGQDASAAQKAADDAVAELAKKADDYSIEIYNGTGGNPKAVKFATVNYSTCTSEAGVAAKISMVSGHGNGTSYAFLQDAIIRVDYVGGVEVDNVKHYGAATPTYDDAVRQYGDIFWVIDTTNKVVDFYCLMGQYARVYQTPWKRLTYSTGGTVTQYTSATVYSSGTKAWANNSDIALASDLASLVANVDVEYCLSDSDETAPTGGWASSPPTIPEGQFLWSRSLVTYTDGTTAYTTPYCVSKAMSESIAPEMNAVTERVEVVEEATTVTLPEAIQDSITTTTTTSREYTNGAVETLRTEREKIIRRDSDGITISDKTDGADEALDMNLDSDHLHFRLNKQPIAGIEVEDDGSGYFFGSDVKVDSTLTLGSFAWTVRHNGNMGLIYIGGE